MKEFDTYCTKYEDHNCAINLNKELKIGPTIRVVEDNGYKLGFTLYKWELQPTGKALAIYVFNKKIEKNDIIWKNPQQSESLKEFQENIHFFSDYLNQFKVDDIIKKIESDSLKSIKIFKYHASQWREIEKKKTKWSYIKKQEKTDICNIQRLLH